jgi:methyl-accepting chemotaxis protein
MDSKSLSVGQRAAAISSLGEALASINVLTKDVEITSDGVKKIAESFNATSKVLDVIRSIADQTNSLALNVAKEVARAGEAGCNLSVVSDEVRALVHLTRQSTTEITSLIDTIYSGTDRAIEAMNESKTPVSNNLVVAEAANESFEITNEAIPSINQKRLITVGACEEHIQVANEADKNLSDFSMQSATAPHQSIVVSQQLSRLAASLTEIISKFKV